VKKILVIFGTRPEAIKMAPVVSAFKNSLEFETRVCVSAQHRGMLDQVLSLFEIIPDYDLNLMTPGQTLSEISSRILEAVSKILVEWIPDLVLIHGDTTTTAMTAIACFYKNIPIGHVEAGLRTGDIWSPWPEEFNRKIAGMVASLHFAPTDIAENNLLRENVPKKSIVVTGNTVIDALFHVSALLVANENLRLGCDDKFKFLNPNKRMLLVTGHRRENFGNGVDSICQALLILARRGDLDIVYSVHPNPNISAPVRNILGQSKNIHLIEPQDYLSFVYLMKRSHLILTDSGGIQEEAPSFGKPVLVMRDTTERPEALSAGTIRLVGTGVENIVSEVVTLLEDRGAYILMSTGKNPYGDGRSAQKICKSVERYFVSL